MKNKTRKFNGSITHQNAILHMIGRSVHIFRNKPKVSEIAEWMGVSKPTARKYLNLMVDQDLLIMTKTQHRPNVECHHYELDSFMTFEYKRDCFKVDYELYAQRVMQIII